MQRTTLRQSRHWLETWAVAAMFALLALCVSPSLAFSCCCHAASNHCVSARKTAPQLAASALPSKPTPPPCGDCASETAPPAPQIAALTLRAASTSTTSTRAKVVAATPASGAHELKAHCDCASADSNSFVAAESASAPQFSPLVASVAVAFFSLEAPTGDSFRLAFASVAARPRSPGAAHVAGRAPPVFGS